MAKASREIVEEVQFCRLYSDGTLLVKELRLSYPNVLIPRKGMAENADKLSFSVVGLAPKKTHLAAKNLIKKRIDQILKEANKGLPLAADRLFLRNGDLSGKPENVGMFTISAREQAARPPIIKGPDKSRWTAEKHAALIYGGCYGNLLIRPWYQPDKGYGKRVNAGLSAVQFLRDGEPFGEGRISEDDIDETFDTEASFDSSDVDDL